jgi:hypothetical protein
MQTKSEGIRKYKQRGTPATVDGYEKVLEVCVPGVGSAEPVGPELLLSFEPDDSRDPEYDFYAPRPDREPYVTQDEIGADKCLRKLFRVSQFDNHAAPVAAGPSRMIVSSGSRLYSEHELVQQTADRDQPITRILLRHLQLHHEVGASDAAGGHFTTLIDPKNAVMGSLLPWSDIHSALWGGDTVPRAIPKQYPETYAVLEELKLAKRLRESDSPFRTLSESIPINEPDVEALKETDRDRLDEIVRSVESEYVERGHELFGRDATTVETATYLRDEVGIDQAIELMKVPQRATMNPDKWVCDVLSDVESGMDPADIPAQSNYWDMRPPVDVDHEYDDVVEQTNRQRERFLNDPDRRARNSTYEVLTLYEDELVREWYSYEPADEFSLKHIRYCLFLQYLFDGVEKKRFSLGERDWILRVVNNGLRSEQAKYEPAGEDGTGEPRPFYEAGYQRDDINPYRRAMAGELDPREIAYYFDYDSDSTLSHYAWKMAARNAADEMGFSDYRTLLDWIENGST